MASNAGVVHQMYHYSPPENLTFFFFLVFIYPVSKISLILKILLLSYFEPLNVLENWQLAFNHIVSQGIFRLFKKEKKYPRTQNNHHLFTRVVLFSFARPFVENLSHYEVRT